MGGRSPLLGALGDDVAWSLLDAIPDATLVVRASGDIAFANDHATDLFGYELGDLLGRNVDDLLPESDRPAHRALRARYREAPVVRAMGNGTTLWARRADGSELPVEISLSPLHLGDDLYAVAAVRDITKRLATEVRLRHSQDALHEAEQVVAVAEDRERIARDLHDTVIQRIFGEGLNLQAALARSDDPRVRERLESSIDGLDLAIKDLRSAVFSLQGATAAPGGLRGRLFALMTEVAEMLGGEPRLQFDGPVETIDDHIAAELVPVLRESLSNIVHHARARHVRVVLEVTPVRITLTVADDGVGVPGEVVGGHGLANMADRARSLGGSFAIVNQPTGGALSTWQVPYRTAPRPQDVVAAE